MEPVRYDFDTSRIHRNQIIHLILLLLMSVPFSVLTFLFRHSPHGESYAFLFWVFIILLPFVIALVRYLMLYKRTIRSYEITTDGIIKINDDATSDFLPQKNGLHTILMCALTQVQIANEIDVRVSRLFE